MDNDPLDGLFPAESGATPTTAPEPTPAPTPQAEPAPPAQVEGGTARDDKGRFAARTPQATPEPTQPAPQTPASDKQPIGRDEFKGYLDEREKRQAAEKRIAEFEARERQREEQQRQQAQVPSIQDDPEGYQQWHQQQLFQATIRERVNVSGLLAREKYGDDTVEQAFAWGTTQAQTVPGFREQNREQPHPVDWLVKQYKRHQLMTQIGDDPDEFVRKRYAELTASQGAPPTEPQPSPAASPQSAVSTVKPQPVRSLASAPSAGGMGAVGMAPEQAFEAVFKR